MLELNRTAFQGNKGGDYRPLVIGTMVEVEEGADNIREVLAIRSRARTSVTL